MAPELVYSRLLPLIRRIRRLFPASGRARIRQLLFQWLDLTWTLPTDVHIRIDHYGAWNIYNEIFVSGEYDQALNLALDSADGRPLQIVDLGANVGFFTLRAVDRLRSRGAGAGAFAITAVEANASCCREFAARVYDENGLSRNVRLVHGAVGERSGVATLHGSSLFDGAQCPYLRTAFPSSRRAGVRVPYVDLSSLLASCEQIDLLKCDIEGAELLFIRNYRDVLQKVRVAVFELHGLLCDIRRCQALLRECGFPQHATFREPDRYLNSTYGVWRPPPLERSMSARRRSATADAGNAP